MYHATQAKAGIGRKLGRRELLERAPHLDPDSWEAVDADFPVGVTRAFSRAMDLSDPRDPVALQVLPDARELQADPGDRRDPVGDAARSPVPWVVQKHADRVLLLVTKRCQVYCRYCFRRDHDPGEALDPSPEEWEAALRWCLASGAKELILSSNCGMFELFTTMQTNLGSTTEMPDDFLGLVQQPSLGPPAQSPSVSRVDGHPR